MPKDATPDELVIINDNFSNANHRIIAETLEEQWSPGATLSSMEDPADAHKSTIQKVYQRYMGVPGDSRTIQEIRDEFGSVRRYLDMREAGEIEVQEDTLDEEERVIFQEGYRAGSASKFAEGWNRALEQVEELGLENVPRMPEDAE